DVDLPVGGADLGDLRGVLALEVDVVGEGGVAERGHRLDAVVPQRCDGVVEPGDTGGPPVEFDGVADVVGERPSARTASPIPRFAAARGEQGGRAERETAAEEGAARQWSGHDG